MKNFGIVLALGLVVGCGASRPRVRDGQPAIVVLRRGAYSGEIALLGGTRAHYAAEDAMIAHCHGRVRFVDASEAERLAVLDPSETGKLREESSSWLDVERVQYVCVTLERTLR